MMTSKMSRSCVSLNEPSHEKTYRRAFRPGPTQTGLYNQRKWLEARNLRIRKKRDCIIYVTQAKVMISCLVTTQLICAFIFYRFSYDAALMFRFFSLLNFYLLIRFSFAFNSVLLRPILP